MKLIQANPKVNNEQTIFSALNTKERNLRGKNTTFYKDKGKWKHEKFAGWVTVTKAPEGIVFAKVQSKSAATEEKIFQAFIGYLTRHCSELIDSLTIYYR